MATAVGAVFLTQLQQVLTANGAAQSVDYMIQGSIIALGMLLRIVPRRRRRAEVVPDVGPSEAASIELRDADQKPLPRPTSKAKGDRASNHIRTYKRPPGVNHPAPALITAGRHRCSIDVSERRVNTFGVWRRYVSR